MYFYLFSLNEPKYQEDLVAFFKMVMECYSKTNRSLKFLIDILEIDIHPSESFEITFAVNLKDFIVDHKLHKPIHDNIAILFVSF